MNKFIQTEWHEGDKVEFKRTCRWGAVILCKEGQQGVVVSVGIDRCKGAKPQDLIVETLGYRVSCAGDEELRRQLVTHQKEVLPKTLIGTTEW